MRSTDYYAAIDLGSNSFHMLVVRVVAGSIQIVSKIKRKVQLAHGLVNDQELAPEARLRALDCLAIFADRVQDIAPENIRAVGTATLRKIKQDQAFLDQATRVLGHPIHVISGKEEAGLIYQGIAHTTSFDGRLLVIDIGGASTELALGEGFDPLELESLDMGCVTWLDRYFENGRISEQNFSNAIAAAEAVIEPHRTRFLDSGWQNVLGASGTFKALREISQARGLPERFTLSWLESLLHEAQQFESIDSLDLYGLKPKRKLIFLTGLCILIALFRQLRINSVEATEGALREGLIYGMLDDLRHNDVQLRTLTSLAEAYHLDQSQAARVGALSLRLLSELPQDWIALNTQESSRLCRAVAYLHEIGLTLNYRNASSHGVYLLKNSNLPGFSIQQKSQLLELLYAMRGIIDDEDEPDTMPEHPALCRLSRILRIAALCCQRRQDDAVPKCHITAHDETIELELPAEFEQSNKYLFDLLTNEREFQSRFGNAALQLVDAKA